MTLSLFNMFIRHITHVYVVDILCVRINAFRRKGVCVCGCVCCHVSSNAIFYFPSHCDVHSLNYIAERWQKHTRNNQQNTIAIARTLYFWCTSRMKP